MTLWQLWLDVPRSLWAAIEFTAARLFGRRIAPGHYVLGSAHYHIEEDDG